MGPLPIRVTIRVIASPMGVRPIVSRAMQRRGRLIIGTHDRRCSNHRSAIDRSFVISAEISRLGSKRGGASNGERRERLNQDVHDGRPLNDHQEETHPPVNGWSRLVFFLAKLPSARIMFSTKILSEGNIA